VIPAAACNDLAPAPMFISRARLMLFPNACAAPIHTHSTVEPRRTGRATPSAKKVPRCSIG
jgi:hypothetical protein